jgi:4-amino-4-deoxy-L-arabinose transferase-like glycosyltransferase
LWESAHPLPDFFYFNHIAQKEGVSVGRFPPGWPAILSVAFLLNIPPFVVNPVLGLISLIVFYLLAVKLYGQRIALWALPALALTSFYIFNSASFFSHSSSLLCVLLFVYGVYCYRENKKRGYLLLAGFALGILMTTRYYTALLVFLPFFFFLFNQYRLKSVVVFFWIGLGCLPCVAAGFWYNYSITGNPLLPVTMWAYNDEALGFVKGHTVQKGIEHVIRWMIMFLYWCSPAVLILYFVFLWKKIRHSTERVTHPEDYIFILLLAGYFFYYEIGGNQYGPRFFFEALPFIVLLVVTRVMNSRSKWMTALFFAGMI